MEVESARGQTRAMSDRGSAPGGRSIEETISSAFSLRSTAKVKRRGREESRDRVYPRPSRDPPILYPKFLSSLSYSPSTLPDEHPAHLCLFMPRERDKRREVDQIARVGSSYSPCVPLGKPGRVVTSLRAPTTRSCTTDAIRLGAWCPRGSAVTAPVLEVHDLQGWSYCVQGTA